MSRADARTRIVEAAQALGTARGVTALTLQGVATAAGVSKALVLYHFGDKEQLLAALADGLVAADVLAVDAAAASADPLDAWRRVAGGAPQRAARALLAALLQEVELRPRAQAVTATRLAAATRLATAMLRAADLRPRIAAPLLGHVLLHQLDGVALTHAATDAIGAEANRDGARDAALDAALDAAALAVLGLGR